MNRFILATMLLSTLASAESYRSGGTIFYGDGTTSLDTGTTRSYSNGAYDVRVGDGTVLHTDPIPAWQPYRRSEPASAPRDDGFYNELMQELLND